MQRLLERDAVLTALGSAARRAAHGDGQLVLLRGEAGVGKTAVLARFVAGLGPSLRVLRGWCDPLAAPRPLGPLVDALADLGGPAAGRLNAAINAGDIAALYAGLLAVLGDGHRWVWVIEDAHWADGATLDLVRFIGRRVGSLPLLLVVSYRDDELHAQHPLALALGDVAGAERVQRIGLAPLSRDAVAIVATGTGINAAQLYQLTGGNPFYVTEVLAAGPELLDHDALPQSVAEAVWGRLGRLGDPARETAYAVAVCGPRTHTDVLEMVCPGAGGALDDCLNAGVLVGDGGVVEFRHELARRATLDLIPDHQRRLLHKRALAVLAKPPVNPDTLAALAFHADQGGDRDAVIRYGPAAADRASTLGANREAAELYALTLRRASTVPAEQMVRWVEQHAFSSYLSGLMEASMSSYRDAIALRHGLEDRLGEGDDLRWLSHILWPFGRITEATEVGRASLRLLEDLGPTPQLAWSLMNMAQLALWTYDPACAEYAARAIKLGTQLNLPAVGMKAGFLVMLYTVLSTNTGWDECETAWREAMATDGLEEHAGFIGGLLCSIAALHHDVERTEGYVSEVAAYCTSHDLGTFHPFCVGAAALVALHRGEWADALAFADEVLTRPAMSPTHRILPLISVALVRSRRGEQPVAALLDEALSAGEPDDLFRLGSVWAARAEAAWLAGDDSTAVAEAQRGLAAATEHADPWLLGHLRRWAYLAGDNPKTAQNDQRTPFDLETSGQWQAATAAWAGRGCPYDAAIAQLGGDSAAVHNALDTFRRLGARAAARRAQQRLAVLRGRTPYGRRADTLADPLQLTRRQREVLDLLAAGHSDAGIAAALHISPKTVGHHVSAIITKLGVDNRTQAAAQSHRHPRTSEA
ncbi:helix-turn-helix transcriptional regulator [Mycolicibacterium sp. CBMA 226]|uniref:helix-turn-helix transcriptional regulator n=1 Tax=Mycolicibacterium sp. CBMA 226 TaxID=2606611 RepID=UPI001305C0CC|nr:helix-turn-helix transcriptional regulator [Mycolicibacterium sp. CBMA 226]MUL75888.1 AAA family ATPase [Mycolicibacterium sp. CBMA 226]